MSRATPRGVHNILHRQAAASIAEQSRQDLISIRAAFLYSDADFGAVVVHGHTPKTDPTLRHNRIGIDTGAVYGGRLTCAILEQDQIAFLFA